jgi:hypothetical protein
MAQMVKCLPSKHETLSLNPSILLGLGLVGPLQGREVSS